MFAYRYRQPEPEYTAKPEPTPEPPRSLKPRPRQAMPLVVALDAYERECESLGWSPPGVLRQRVLELLRDEDIPVYDYDEVARYMIADAAKQCLEFGWKPLRPRDLKFKPHGYYRNPDYSSGGSCQSVLYNKDIPIHVLRHMNKIEQKFGPQVGIWVSDYAVPNPDPFACIALPGDLEDEIRPIVFAVWDEPGFGKLEEK